MNLRILSLLAVATATLATAQAASATTLIANGDFEMIGAGAAPEGWGGLTYYVDGTHPGHVFLPGWKVESGSVDLTQTTSVWGPANTNTYSMDINGWDAGTISQDFDTIAGRIYTVSYAFSRNPGGAPDPAIATVFAGGVTQTVTAANDGSFGGGHSMAWKTNSFTFVGDGSPTTIRLAAVTGGNGGVFFDTVSVSGGIPEPATWALMIGGFGMAGAMLRRKRAAAAAA